MPEEKIKLTCGVVMPISAIDECTESHWADVLEIILEAIDAAGFQGNLVSNADEVGLIHKRIIQNLYDNPIVVCDVSGKNPNVMFELGMRLAFDKPTVIIKDDKTSYSFDTSAIEHLEYPRDLRFTKIVEFKQKLAEKIKATHERSTQDGSYTTFLKHFGEFTVAKLEKKEVPGQEFILQELKAMRQSLSHLEALSFPRRDPGTAIIDLDTRVHSNTLILELEGLPKELADELLSSLSKMAGIQSATIFVKSPDNHGLRIRGNSTLALREAKKVADGYMRHSRRNSSNDSEKNGKS